MNKIFVLGSINMDLVFAINAMPKRGETIASESFFMTPGGKGANQAVAASQQGIDTYMIGSIGSDGLSSTCLDSLMKYHVKTDYIDVLTDTTCGVAGILLEANDNRIIVDAGANAIHDSKRITSIIEEHGLAEDIIIAQLEIPTEVILLAFTKAKEAGMITILNAAPAKELPLALYKVIDYLVVNESEMELLTGVTPNAKSDIIEASNRLFDLGIQNIILTLGKDGSVLINKEEYFEQLAYQVDVTDTTAAGDTYIGVFASELIQEKSIQEAMNRASIAASLSIQKLGAQQSIPSRHDIDKSIGTIKEKQDE